VPAATPAPSANKDASAKGDLKSSEPVPPYELKTRSSFVKMTEATRAPFWPIGWVKRAKAGAIAAAPVSVAPKVLLDEKSFRVTSILVGSGTTASLAIINGRPYSEGEFLRMPKAPGTMPIRIRVQRINDGNVILQNGEQILVASLQRPELSNPKPEQLLDDKDR
jgi:hypothetical protein